MFVAIQALTRLAGNGEIFPSSPIMDKLVTTMCPSSTMTANVCSNLLFALTGPDVDQLNQVSSVKEDFCSNCHS